MPLTDEELRKLMAQANAKVPAKTKNIRYLHEYSRCLVTLALELAAHQCDRYEYMKSRTTSKQVAAESAAAIRALIPNNKPEQE